MGKEELIQSIIENLAKCQRPALNASWKDFGLSHAQGGMLYLLAYHRAASVKETADYLGITKSAATQLLDPLVVKGLVSRETDPKDRRIVRLSLTGSGSAALKKIARHKFAGLRSALQNLNDAELRQLQALHQKLVSKKI